MKYFLLTYLTLIICIATAKATPTRPCNSFKTLSQVTLTGQVFCKESKNPITSHITVTVDGTDPIYLSDLPDGKFIALLPPAVAFTIRAEAKGYESHELTYSIPACNSDTTLFVEIFLTPSFELTLSGSVLDAKTDLPINAELDLYYDSDMIKEDIQIIHDGKYKEVLSKVGWYIIEISAPGYVGISDTLWFVDEKRNAMHKDYRLTPIEVGLNVIIDHVYFYFGKTSLRPESFEALNQIANLINSNPMMVVEIAGHTDDEGAADYNLFLSQGRAQAVVNQLVKLGVEPARLIAKGYGEERPIDQTNTKTGKAKNRRVEFTVVSLDALNK